MRTFALLVIALSVPRAITAQASTPRAAPDGVVVQFVRFADIYGARLVEAFESIPAARYDYRPTPIQQTIGYIAQHLENANYGLCERLGDLKHPRTAKDSIADTVKARWPKDTLVARLEASLRFCDEAMERLPRVDSPAVAATLIGIETDLAEHYSQLSSYMRLIGLVPPSALPPKPRAAAVELPESALTPYAGVYEVAPGMEL
ncbi:MAG TPA: DinB family protein, partial [Gemmatimonadaceae bacterium]|nr:DinB family protein [Gemmatimonadaceae bacterium]